jgi:hypothetical protein
MSTNQESNPARSQNITSNSQNSDQNQQTSGPDTTQENSDSPGDQGNLERYSNLGPHGQYLGPDPADKPDDYDNPDLYNTDDQDVINREELYGDQDQYGDQDNLDPYSNLYNEDPGSTAGGEGLYELEEPLAKQGDVSKKGRDTDRYRTRWSQDQNGYQQ